MAKEMITASKLGGNSGNDAIIMLSSFVVLLKKAVQGSEI
jgi:hypothetical protein